MRENLAKSTRDEKMMYRLTQDIYPVTAAVALNPNVPIDLLVQLAGDSFAEVRRAAAKAHKIPSDLLAQLACDKELCVRLSAAKNPKCPAETVAAVIASYPIKQEYTYHYEDGVVSESFEYGPKPIPIPDEGSLRYANSIEFGNVSSVVKAHNPQKRLAIIEELKKINSGLAVELEPYAQNK